MPRDASAGRSRSPDRRAAEECLERVHEFAVGPFSMVIFGGAGDLASRKLLPALYYLYTDEHFPDAFEVLGVGLPGYSDAKYRRFAEAALKKFSPEIFRAGRASGFARNLSYLTGDLDDDKTYRRLRDHLVKAHGPRGLKDANIVIYLAVPPQLIETIVRRLERAGLCRALGNGKLVVEKPFGKDRRSADKLDRTILEAFDERQIFRIDHYLAKETVQNILFFRFGNSIFEPLWNTRFIDHVQITVAESLGIEHRGAFYEQVGVIRDIIQNHMMQILALVAMEPPSGFDADLVRNEKSKVFHSIRRMDLAYARANTVCGQYGPGRVGGRKVRSYRQEDHVASGSMTPTFFAGKVYIDNWRWAGVPFYLRTGKRLPERVTEIYVEFKQLPLELFGKTCEVIQPNGLVLNIQPQEEIDLRLTVKYPGLGDQPSPADMAFNYSRSFKVKQHPAYERVVVDCIKGDLTLFPRQDEVDATWKVLDPLIRYWERHSTAVLPNYPAGSWGPLAAFTFMAREGRTWRLSGDIRTPGSRPEKRGKGEGGTS
jgi:glucose-6-phosphate 1-dehydrogenase